MNLWPTESNKISSTACKNFKTKLDLASNLFKKYITVEILQKERELNVKSMLIIIPFEF